MLDLADNKPIRCPTCGANQPRAAECRRCKCDLNLYVTTLQSCQWWKRQVLERLRDGRFDEALRAARHYATLSPDPDAARWIAVIQLLRGSYSEALSAGSQ